MLSVPRWRVFAVLIATAWAVIFAAPNFLPEPVRASLPDWLPQRTVNLGLDLQGGSHLLLEVDSAKLTRDKLDNALDGVSRALSDAEPAIRSTGRAVVGDTMRLRLVDPARQSEAVRIIAELGQPTNAGFGGGSNRFDINPGPDGLIEISFTPEAREAEIRQAVAQAIEVIRRRIDPTGTSEITILRQGVDRIVVQAPGENDPEALKERIGRTAQMTFHLVDDGVSPLDLAEGRIPPGVEALPQPDEPSEPIVPVRRRAVLTGENLLDASPGFHPTNGSPIVNFQFDSAGARTFCRLTNQNVGRRFATVLDGVVITAPRINTPICGGRGFIEGNFTVETSTELAVLLKAGALPAPLTVIEQRTVGAELGQDAINAGAIAGVIAAVGVLVFMALVYGLFGLIACVALVLNMLMIVAAMSLIGATLTLPGIAGLILTMAMAVDANVLIYERMRDEQAAGRTAPIAADSGFQRAIVTIMDANLTTILAALILFQFGAGPVRGFAWTLSIGVVTSVFTAVLVTQILIAYWVRVARPKKLPI